MIDTVQHVLREKCLLNKKIPIIVAVSGGPDSLCLLDLLWQLQYPVIVAHFDHALRLESAQEANAVQNLSQSMDLAFISIRRDAGEYAKTNRMSIEEASRNLRYKFFFDQAEKHCAQAVCVGHNADDQVETILMHLLRGSGLPGLTGMAYRSVPNPWSNEIPLIRPLLDFFREQVNKYIEARGLQPCIDVSNLDVNFYRNRLRHELIPYLESYNPKFKTLILRSAKIIQEDYAVIQEHVDSSWTKSIIQAGKNFIGFDLEILRAQPLSIRRHLVRRAVNSLRPGLRNLDFQTIERAIAFIDTPSTSKQMDLIAKLRLKLEDGQLWLAKWNISLPALGWPQIKPNTEVTLHIPGTSTFSESWEMDTELNASTEVNIEKIQNNKDPFQAWFDYDTLNLPLKIRPRSPGDRIQPLGMDEHSVKVSELMLNLKIPSRARERWPLVLSGSDIIWIPGLRMSNKYRLTKETQKFLHLSMVKK